MQRLSLCYHGSTDDMMLKDHVSSASLITV